MSEHPVIDGLLIVGALTANDIRNQAEMEAGRRPKWRHRHPIVALFLAVVGGLAALEGLLLLQYTPIGAFLYGSVWPFLTGLALFGIWRYRAADRHWNPNRRP